MPYNMPLAAKRAYEVVSSAPCGTMALPKMSAAHNWAMPAAMHCEIPRRPAEDVPSFRQADQEK